MDVAQPSQGDIRPMIHIILRERAPEGRVHYRIETPGTRLAVPFDGLAVDPLMDACRKLRQLGAASDDALIGTFLRPGLGDTQFIERASVGYVATVERQARSMAARQPPRTPPASPGGTGRVPPEPPRPGSTHRKRKRAKSGARPGRR